MIIFKIIGVLLLIILVLLVVAICIPVGICVIYDNEAVSLEIKYLFVSFRRKFDGEEETKTSENSEPKQPTVFDKLLTLAAEFFKKTWRSIKMFCSKAANFLKRTMKKIRNTVKSKLKRTSKSKKKKTKKQGGSSEKTSKTKTSDQNLFDSLKEERGFWGAVGFFVDIGKALGGGLVKIYRGIAADKFILKVKIVGEDAADTAIKYGEVCTAAFPALSFLLSNMRRYKQDIEITPDFDSDEGRIYFEGEFQIFPVLVIGQALGAVIKFAAKQIKITMENQSKK